MSNVRGRDLGGFTAEVRARIDHDVSLPPGYFVEYGGQFENQQRATRRLMLIVPVAIALIFILLYLTFTSVKLALLVVGNVPFALVGGVAARDEPQPLGVHWIHRTLRRGNAQRGRPRQLYQSNARRRLCAPQSGTRRRPPKAAPSVDDGICSELWLHPDGDLNLNRSRGTAATSERGDRRPVQLHSNDTFSTTSNLRMDMFERPKYL
jgi:hypothetical protein